MRLAQLATMICFLILGSVHPTSAVMPLQPPTGSVILEVSGSLALTNADGVARFDREMLEGLGLRTMRTSTAWTAGISEFQGVLIRDLLAAVGAEGHLVIATALNDYQISVSLNELRSFPVMLALKMDGQYLTMRDKGPIWIVYPRDQYVQFQNSEADKRWIWQLAKIEIK